MHSVVLYTFYYAKKSFDLKQKKNLQQRQFYLRIWSPYVWRCDLARQKIRGPKTADFG